MPTGLARIIHERRRKTPVSLMTQCNLAIRKFNKVLDAFSCWHGTALAGLLSQALRCLSPQWNHHCGSARLALGAKSSAIIRVRS